MVLGSEVQIHRWNSLGSCKGNWDGVEADRGNTILIDSYEKHKDFTKPGKCPQLSVAGGTLRDNRAVVAD